jgi:hypothetical protein
MSWRTLLLLALLGLCMSFAVAQFQPFPGYLDADYYFAGGIELASGKGFSEPYLWNYLDNSQALPHPSHTYWMPLASVIAAAGLWLTGQTTYGAGRIGFLVLAALVPVVTAVLAHSLSHRRDLALISGLLAVFSIYYVPFLPVSDNYAAYLVLGGLFFLALGIRRSLAYVSMGALAGLLTLARTDGVLWLAITLLVIFKRALWPAAESPNGASAAASPYGRKVGGARFAATSVALALAGYGLVTAPWFLHMQSLYGTLFAPSGGRLLWLTKYDETFVYPASQLTPARWLAQGWSAIISARLVALKWNLLNAFAAQGGVFLAPFIIVAACQLRRDERAQVAVLGWLALLLVMTLVFPFAGYRGGFFHAGAALQSFWWALAPLGLEAAVVSARRRNMFTPEAFTVFRIALVGIAVLMTGLIVAIRVLPGWGEGEQNYPRIEGFLKASGIAPGTVVMVRNPPGYFIMTGRPAIVVPYGDAVSIRAAAARYGAQYLIVETAGAAGPIKSVYEDTTGEFFDYLGDVDGTRIFRIRP